MAASAYSSCSAAVRLANVSGSDVPSAMMVMPDTAARRPTTQPSSPPICGTKTGWRVEKGVEGEVRAKQPCIDTGTSKRGDGRYEPLPPTTYSLYHPHNGSPHER